MLTMPELPQLPCTAWEEDPLQAAIRETVDLINRQAEFLAESKLDSVQRAGLKFLAEKLNTHLNHLLNIQIQRLQ